jgi:hypothetical protein
MDKSKVDIPRTAEQARHLSPDLQAKVDAMDDQVIEDGQEEVFSKAEVERGVMEQVSGAKPDPKAEKPGG